MVSLLARNPVELLELTDEAGEAARPPALGGSGGGSGMVVVFDGGTLLKATGSCFVVPY